MSEIFQFRAFQSAKEQAQRLGTHATMAIIRRVREEQRAGRSGTAVAAELMQRRFAGQMPSSPEDAA